MGVRDWRSKKLPEFGSGHSTRRRKPPWFMTLRIHGDKAKLHFPDLLHHHPPPHSPATLALSPVYNFSLRRKSSVGQFQLDYDLEQQITSLESFLELDGDTVEQPESIR